ncbi:3-methyladenine DNA glycosylase 2 [Burkholderia sp. WAC0059]|nr:DNA-3-methyladenine glycosylase [Burkholderia sp. WAC0059]PLZ02057.1 3-methyladenine DNA glycosylase 2 [Burkholderia sp. WAC0059]
MPHPGAVTLDLPFRAPYDWPRVLRFLAGRAIPGVETVEANAWRRAIEWAGASGMLTVRRHPRRPCLGMTVEGPASVHAAALVGPVSRLFDLHAEPAAIAAHLGSDPWLAPLVEAAPGLRVPGAWSGFELVVRAIVGQQISVKAATTIVGRLVGRAGRPVEGFPAGTASLFPTPAALAGADLAAIGMPGRRVAALQGFAQAVATGALPIDGIDPANDSGVTTDETRRDLTDLRAKLLALPGIGPWTVEYVAMRAWRDPDAWPASDLVLVQAIAARDPMLGRAAGQRVRTDAWRPWRAYAAMHLWNEIADRAGAARGG